MPYITPDWPFPNNVKAYSTIRDLNLAMHVNDDPKVVQANRLQLHEQLNLPQTPLWLTQVHGATVIQADNHQDTRADAAFTQQAGYVCTVLTADCLPLLICDRAGTWVAAIHAGWRGLAAGIIEATLKNFNGDRKDLLVWLGPAIGPKVFEVGLDVYEAFCQPNPQAAFAFETVDANHYLADIYLLARQRLAREGVTAIYGGDLCTYSDPQRFYSYRRDGQTGRMASLIWLQRSS